MTKETGQLKESTVTDSKGRYYFIVNPAKHYRITVTRDGFNFPSKLMEYIDSSVSLYGGGDISFEGSQAGDLGLITYQVPVDPQQGEVFIDDNHRKKVSTSIRGYKDFQTLSGRKHLKEKIELFVLRKEEEFFPISHHLLVQFLG